MSIELLPLGQKCQLSCGYCATPDTPVLMRSGSWKALGDLAAGDLVWAFDEHKPGDGTHRKLRAAPVTRTFAFAKEAVRVMHSGGEMVVGADHRMLSGEGRWTTPRTLKTGHTLRRLIDPAQAPVETDTYRLGYVVGILEGDGSLGVYLDGNGYFQWAAQLVMRDAEALERAGSFAGHLGAPLQTFTHMSGGRHSFSPDGTLTPGLRTRRRAVVARLATWIAAPREEEREWLRGWIAGMFDAEGSVSAVLRISQKDTRRKERIGRALSRLGYAHVIESSGVRLLGGTRAILRFFAEMQPALIRKLAIDGRAADYQKVTVERIERVGVTDMADLTVAGHHTYFAAGIASHNCYEEPLRNAGNEGGDVQDWPAMFAALEREGVGSPVAGKPERKTGFTLFGGEPLLLPRPDLMKVCDWAQAKGVPLAVQTNGELITDWHVSLFAKYGVSVGISVDGPDELNDTRWKRNVAATRSATERTMGAIRALCAAGRPPSLIVTLTQGNASPERLPRLLSWIKSLVAMGVRSFNFHTLEVDNGTDALQLSTADAVAAARDLMDLSRQLGVTFSPWADMAKALSGDDDDDVNCIWHACDPLSTNAVRGIDGQGHRKNCGRVAKDGVQARKADRAGHERQIALYLTPQEHGGCQGCRFFVACLGECPGTGERGDWRSKTAHCATLQGTFPLIERQLTAAGKVPISLSLDRARVEAALIDAWSRGETLTRTQALTAKPSRAVAHGDQPHGDKPHGDSNHGDHTDQAAKKEPQAVTA